MSEHEIYSLAAARVMLANCGFKANTTPRFEEINRKAIGIAREAAVEEAQARLIDDDCDELRRRFPDVIELVFD